MSPEWRAGLGYLHSTFPSMGSAEMSQNRNIQGQIVTAMVLQFKVDTHGSFKNLKKERDCGIMS